MTGLPAGTGGSVQPAGRRGCLPGGRRAYAGGVFVLLVQSVMRRWLAAVRQRRRWREGTVLFMWRSGAAMAGGLVLSVYH